ncbi:MAG TPA: alanine--tRNA ligase, partial [Xanthomonadales bacterium]|nr:alanine--tRNA ligase [Xanthomonadales bacterium]
SSPLVPANDPTLLFTNAGMVQFKDVFLGSEKRDCPRAVTSQRCVRAGGKHNDLDQVGYTARHHTFFEMLGNFSFGDYFKHDAIRLAWELLTDVWALDPDRLWVTVYQDDDDAWHIWAEEIGIPKERLIRIGDKPGGQPFESDNFWAMGDTGPCGPCTEIFYDHGPELEGGPPGSPDEDGDRFVEIWNLVFMQFDRSSDGSMNALPKPCVDTGMGLERMTAVLQGVHSNYQIDLFKNLISAAARVTGAKTKDDPSLNVIADHIRACAFLVADGVVPSREGRGYVLRRIIRRAIRHGFKLGQRQPFFSQLVEPLAKEMGDAYPVLLKKKDYIADTLLEEEKRFSKTLDTGMGILASVMEKANASENKEIDGDTAFLLYDTYGFPLDLTQDVAREHSFTVDTDGFDAAMAEQQERGRAGGRFDASLSLSADVMASLSPTEFLGYETLEANGARVVEMIADGKSIETLEAGQEAVVILDKTPFYAESGGQVGDTGLLKGDGCEFQVTDTLKLGGAFHAHAGKVKSGKIDKDSLVSASVDAERRQSIVLHHSATHLLHAALKQVLGKHVEQRGSLVAPDHLRFDFTHPKAVSDEELTEIERLINAEIRANPDSEVSVMGFDEALETGAEALFGEKYGDQVRVLKFGDFSIELCGGTHVERVGDIGQFKIIEESSIASGIRRIVGVAGEAAVRKIQQTDSQIRQLSRMFNVSADDLEKRVIQLMERSRSLEKDLERANARIASSSGDELASEAVTVGEARVLAAQMDGLEAKAMRETVDRIKNKLGSAVVVIGSVDGEKVRLAAGVSEDLISKVKAGDLVNFVADQVGGRGGGRPDFAQAGGSEPDKLPAALASVTGWVEKNL